jgi:hypothetical protein
MPSPLRRGEAVHTFKAFYYSKSKLISLVVAVLGLLGPLTGCTAELVEKPVSADLAASTSSLNLGSVAVGASSSRSFSLENKGASPISLIGLSVVGQSFSVSGQSPLPAKVESGGSYTVTISFKPSSSGPESGELNIASANKKDTAISIELLGTGTAIASAQFKYAGSTPAGTVVPPDAGTTVSSDFFGMTIEHTFTPFPTFPVATMRFWDVATWAELEPTDGEFDWTTLDSSLAMGQKNGVRDFLFTFGNIPAWASTDPSVACAGRGNGSCAPPNMTAFDDFASALVKRYCGKINFYETWNEPNDPATWTGTNTQLLTVAEDLYKIARDPANCGCTKGVCAPNGGANPNRVLTPTISRIVSYNLTWLDTYLDGTSQPYPYADIFSFHGYGATNPEEIAGQVQSLNQLLAKHGLSHMPVWNTEANWGSTASVGQQQASWLMRYHVALAATGVSRFIWYAYDNCSWGTLWEGYCPNPQMQIEHTTDGGLAYRAVEDWLNGAVLTGCQFYENGLWACELQRSDDYEAWILWSSTGAAISVPIPDNTGLTVYRDWENNTGALPGELSVTDMPVLLESHDL